MRITILAILAILATIGIATAAYAYQDCRTSCWRDWQGNQHCDTICSR